MKGKFQLLQTRLLCCLALVVPGLSLVPVTASDSAFSDANWIRMGDIPGANGVVRAAVVDGSGNLNIRGDFTIVGDVIVNGIAKQTGTLAAPASGVANTATVADDGVRESVTFPATNSPQFFRLRRP